MTLQERLAKLRTRGQLDEGTLAPIKPIPAAPKPVATRQPTVVGRTTGERLAQAPMRGALGSSPQLAGTKGRMLADFPANEQIGAINRVLAGENIPNEFVNNFVRQSAAKGMNPEQIRQAFIAEQRASKEPLMLL